MGYGVPDKVSDKFLAAAKTISDEEFKQKYGNLNQLFKGDVARAQAFAYALTIRESNGNPTLVNQIGYTGWFQMRQDTSFSETDYVNHKIDKNGNDIITWSAKGVEQAKKLGVEVKEGQTVEAKTFQKLFQDTPESHAFQQDAFFQYLNKVVTYPKSKETINKLVGSEPGYKVNFKGTEYPATPEGALAAIHLLGHSGSYTSLVLGKGGADSNGTSAQEYVATFSGQFKNKKGEEYWDREQSYQQIAAARGKGVAQPNINVAQTPTTGTTQQPVTNQKPPVVQSPYPTTENEQIAEMKGFLMILAMIVNALAEPEKQQNTIPAVSTNVISPPPTTPNPKPTLVATAPSVNQR